MESMPTLKQVKFMNPDKLNQVSKNLQFYIHCHCFTWELMQMN